MQISSTEVFNTVARDCVIFLTYMTLTTNFNVLLLVGRMASLFIYIYIYWMAFIFLLSVSAAFSFQDVSGELK